MRYVLCIIVLLSCFVESVMATEYFISPSGSNSNSGTSSGSPWLTFAFAIPQLDDGDILTLNNGTYTQATTGLISINCATTASDGTALLPITVRAANERQALLSSNGLQAPLAVTNCSYWTIEGLHVRNADNTSATSNIQGHAAYVDVSDHIVIRRLLLEKPNRTLNCHALHFNASSDILAEENEAYTFHRHGITSFNSSNIILRRNYVNSRDYADIPGYASGAPTTGDEGQVFYQVKNGLAENGIVENTNQGFLAHGGTGSSDTGVGDDHRFFGNIAISTNNAGFYLDSRCSSTNPCTHADKIVADNTFTNNVSIDSAAVGFYMRGGQNIQFNHSSCFTASSTCILYDLKTENANLSSTAFTTNSLDADGGTYGFRAITQSNWGFNFVNAFGNSTNFSPVDSHLTNSSILNPSLGGCRAWIPDSSPMKGAGLNGADIGANILYRYEDGTLTDTPLWNTSTGSYPCGAVVSGVNDVAGSSCSNVHTRLNINAGGCSFPSGYGSTE